MLSYTPLESDLQISPCKHFAGKCRMKQMDLSSNSREHFSDHYIEEYVSAVNHVVVF